MALWRILPSYIVLPFLVLTTVDIIAFPALWTPSDTVEVVSLIASDTAEVVSLITP